MLILSDRIHIGLVYLFFGSYSDRVTVANAITLKDKFENLGARYGVLFCHSACIYITLGLFRTSHQDRTRLLAMERLQQQFSTLSIPRVSKTLLPAATPLIPDERANTDNDVANRNDGIFGDRSDAGGSLEEDIYRDVCFPKEDRRYFQFYEGPELARRNDNLNRLSTDWGQLVKFKKT